MLGKHFYFLVVNYVESLANNLTQSSLYRRSNKIAIVSIKTLSNHHTLPTKYSTNNQDL